MIRKIFQSVLCICLSPLLAAQKVELPAAPSTEDQPAIATTNSKAPDPVRIPRGAEISLVLLDTVSSSKSKPGDAIRLAVAKDFVVDGVIVVPAGTLVFGTVATAKPAIAGKRDGDVEFDVRKIALGPRLSLRITDSYSLVHDDPHSDFREALFIAVTSPIWVPVFPIFVVAETVFDRDPETHGPIVPKDIAIPACFALTYYIKKEKNVPIVDLSPAQANVAADVAACSRHRATTAGLAEAP